MTLAQRLLVVLSILAALSGLMLAQAILPMPSENLFWRSVFDATHVPVFGVFALVVRLLADWTRRRTSWLHDVVALIAAGLLGALVEVAQSFTGRDAALMDLVRDLLGAAAVLLLARAIVGRPWRGLPVRLALTVLALALTATALKPPVEGIMAYRQRDSAFPILCSFETDWASRFWATRNVEVVVMPPPVEWTNAGTRRVARLTYLATEYPAFILREPHRDWSDRELLVIEAYNPGTSTLTLMVRIDDARHNGSLADRYDGPIELHPGASTIELSLDVVQNSPREREMDMKQVRSFTLFAARPSEIRTIYLSRIRLR